MNTDSHGFQHTNPAKPHSIADSPFCDLNTWIKTGVVEWISNCIAQTSFKTKRRILPAIALFASTLLSIDSAYSQFVLEPGIDSPVFNSGVAAWADYDRDGRMDVLLSGYVDLSNDPGIALWHNTGSGFSNVTAIVAPGLMGFAESSAAWGDFDNDGLLDFVITGMTNFTTRGVATQVWRNTGSGFTNVPIPCLSGVKAGTVAVCDFDCDGRLDFLFTGTTNVVDPGDDFRDGICQLWRNTGNGFTNVPIPGLRGFYRGSVVWGDFDNDGRPDFFVAGMAAPVGLAAELWRNTGDGFTNVPIPGLDGAFTGSVAWGDIDNDGLLDLFVNGINDNPFESSQVWRNTGSGFTNVPVPGLRGVQSGSWALGDYDSDGRLDFLITGMDEQFILLTELWRNVGSGFTNVPVSDLPRSFFTCLGWADYNNDGRLDFVLSGLIDLGTPVSQLWRNQTLSSNSPPDAPTGLLADVSGSSVILKWDLPMDDHTPSSGLSYNVRMGTAPGASDVVSAPSMPDGKLLIPRMGAARNGSAALYQLQPGRTYYWSVQAVDPGFAGSPFALEQQFSTLPIPVNPVLHATGAFEFDFNNRTVLSFDVLASTDATPSPTSWTNLGPATSLGDGVYRFTDSDAGQRQRRFYRLQAQQAL